MLNVLKKFVCTLWEFVCAHPLTISVLLLLLMGVISNDPAAILGVFAVSAVFAIEHIAPPLGLKHYGKKNNIST